MVWLHQAMCSIKKARNNKTKKYSLEVAMIDLDDIRDPNKHDTENINKKDEELINSWVSRKN